jgi:hypothetical protein
MRASVFTISFIAFAIFSCETEAPKKEKEKPKKVEGQEPEYKPEIISGVERIKIGVGEEKEESSIAYSYYRLSEKSFRYEEEINKFLASSITTEIEESSRPKGDIKLSPIRFRTILKQFKSEFDKYGEDYPWYYYDSTFIDESFEKFVQVKRNNYSFTGGAHGNAYVSNNLFSKETGEQLKLKDFISDVPKLTKIGDKYFRQTVEIQATDDLEEQGFWFTKGFELNGNFYFENNKMIFVYNQYEIGPYSMGIISVEIPIREIKSLFKIDLKGHKNNLVLKRH